MAKLKDLSLLLPALEKEQELGSLYEAAPIQSQFGNLFSEELPVDVRPIEPSPGLITLGAPKVELDTDVVQKAAEAVKAQEQPRIPASVEEQPEKAETNLQPKQEQSNYYDTLKAALSAMSGAQAMAAGVERKPNLAILDDLRDAPKRVATQKALEQGLEAKDIELQSEREKGDPNSLISQVYRSAAQKIGIQVPETATARSLESIIGKNILGSQASGKLMRAGTTPEGKPVFVNSVTGEYQIGDIQLADSAFTTKDPVTGETLVLGRRGGGLIKKIGEAAPQEEGQLEKTYKNLKPKQKELLNKTQEQVKKDEIVAGGREALVAANNAITLLDQGTAQGQDIVRAIQNMLSRATGERGVMTEADVAPFGGGASIQDRLTRYLSVAAKGKLPEDDRKFLKDFATALQKAARNRVESGAQPFIKELADKVEVTPENAKKLLSVEELSGQTKKNEQAQMRDLASLVKIKDTKTGKVKAFPSEQAEKILKQGGDRYLLVE